MVAGIRLEKVAAFVGIRKQHEAFCKIRALYYLRHTIAGGFHRVDERCFVTSIDHDFFDKRAQSRQPIEERDPAVLILHVRRGNLDAKQPSIAIDGYVPLAAKNL